MGRGASPEREPCSPDTRIIPRDYTSYCTPTSLRPLAQLDVSLAKLQGFGLGYFVGTRAFNSSNQGRTTGPLFNALSELASARGNRCLSSSVLSSLCAKMRAFSHRSRISNHGIPKRKTGYHQSPWADAGR